jgi:hypothetical protein
LPEIGIQSEELRRMWWHPDLCSFASTRSRDYVLEEDFSYRARMPEINRRSTFSDLSGGSLYPLVLGSLARNRR